MRQRRVRRARRARRLRRRGATVGNSVTIGFQFDSPEELQAFHAKVMELGATNEGNPGPRGGDGSPLHLAYVRDPDGSKLCGYHLVPREKR